MKKLLFNSLLVAGGLLALTSCSRKLNFVTKGLPNADSSYLVTTDGKRIDAITIEVNSNNKLLVDGHERSLDNLSAIKSKKMYFGVSGSHMYYGESYGRICVLYEFVSGSSYMANTRMGNGNFSGDGSPGSYTSTTTKLEYIQKLGSAHIDPLNIGTLTDYVSDNDEAAAMAASAKSWQKISRVSFFAFLGSGVYTAVVSIANQGKTDASGNHVSPSITGPAIALGTTYGVHLIAGSIQSHKIRKAIRIYNNATSETAQ